MNERISELCHQAYEFANSNCADEFGSVDEYKRRSKFEEKFAELIVQECVDVIKQNEGSSLTVSNFTDEKIQGIQLGLGFAICDIKEHFGVEE